VGDPVDPGRAGPADQRGKRFTPQRADLPDQYAPLLDWYRTQYSPAPESHGADGDPILSLRGLGRGIWAGEHPDQYVARLRSDWS
jgi:hypothetical protein